MNEGSVEKEKRVLAKEAIEELGSKFKPILFEDDPADSKHHIKDWWRSKIKEEDTKFLVLILNNILSAAVFDEFKTASEYGVKTFVFLMNKKRVSDKELEKINYPESGLIISDDELRWFYRRINSTKHKEIKEDDEFKKDIKDAVFQYLEVSPEVPRELQANILSKEDPELKRILKVYVKPVKYADASSILYKNRFLIITGDANIGKTSMAQHLAGRIRFDYTLSRMIKIDECRTDIALFKNVENSIIIFDDAFGKSKFGDSGDYSGNIKEIVDLKDNNFVIVTTRRQILDEAKKRQTRFAEYYKAIEDNFIEFSQEGSYSDGALRAILEKHLDYYYEISKIHDSEVEIAQKNTEKIINNLRFPHNIDILVKEELKKVTNGKKDFDDAIEEAKHIKRIAKNWFLNLDDKRKYFVFTVAMFPGFDEETFGRIYEKIIEALQKRHIGLATEDPNALRRDTSAYITETGRIGFNHPNYGEGVKEGIEEDFKRDLVEVIFTLEELAKDEDKYVRGRVVDALGEIGTLKPDKALPLLKQLAKDKDGYIKRAAADALKEIGTLKPDETIPLLKEWVEDDKVDVRWAAADTLREIGTLKPDETIPLLKERANDKYGCVRRAVADTLIEIGKVKPDKIIPVLKEWAKEGRVNVRWAIADTFREIGKVKPDETIPLLKEWAKDGRVDVRWAVASALREIGRIKPDETIPLLKELAKDENGFVRWAVASALREIGRIKPDETIPLLKELAKDEDGFVKWVVASALGEIGKVKPDEALPLLKELAKDEDEFVRRAAIKAIQKIQRF
jgi:HEAT repeat protein